MVDDFRTPALATRLQIPLIYGIDSVHGDNNVSARPSSRTTSGSAPRSDPALVERTARYRLETWATGQQWAFAPVHLRRARRALGAHV